MNLKHVTSINRISVPDNTLEEIKERKRLKDRRPSPADHNPSNYVQYYKSLKVQPVKGNLKMKETLRLYDPIWHQSRGKLAALGSQNVEPGPANYKPKKSKSSKPGTF